jgi:hypothetical protein
MSIQEEVLGKLQALPPEKQQEVLDFAEFLGRRGGPVQPKRRLRGLCADLGVHLSAEEIDEARRGMWAAFPREDV